MSPHKNWGDIFVSGICTSGSFCCVTHLCRGNLFHQSIASIHPCQQHFLNYIMTITHTTIYRYSIKMEPFVIATGTMHYAQNVFIRIHTNNGFYGVGECSAFPMIVGETQDTCLVIARAFAKLLKGKNPLDLADRLLDMETFIAYNNTIKSAFDMALHDIAAKAAMLPLYQFLGGEKRTIETDMTVGIASAEVMTRLAMQYEKDGANILKIKLGKNVTEDVQRIQSIRTAISPATRLRIDANQGWSFDEALYALTAMKDFDIQFCEQPMRTWYNDALPALCRQSPIPIMADESCYNEHDARMLIEAKACHSINIKLAKSGGLATAKKIHDTAATAGIPCMMGGMLESRLALTAKLHFVYASPNIKFYDMDTCKLGHLEDPVVGGATYTGFYLVLDDAPGIGADVDESYLQSCEQCVI